MLERLRRWSAKRATVDSLPEPIPAGVVDLTRFPGVSGLLEAGDVDAALMLMQRLDQALTAQDMAGLSLQLRNEAFRMASLQPAPNVPWPPETDRPLGAAGTLPEVSAADLDHGSLVDGVRNHGALIVRGFVSQQVCERMIAMIDNSMAAFGKERDLVDQQWNLPLRNIAGEILGADEFRAFNFGAAGLPVADAPAAAEFVLAEFGRLGVPELVQAYLGERPAVSLEKWTMRRVPPDTGSSWHQDGAFLGTDKRTLNMWIALSDCGERASGLDIVAHRFDHIVRTGTPGAYFDWDVSPTVVNEERGSDPIVAPVFKAGDAVFFDQFLLHKTGTKPDLSEDRYALETWFFTPTSFPGHYSGLLL